MPKPVTVSTEVARPREEVFDFLDDLSNHAGFLDHILDKWSFSGPSRGVGAKAEARQNAPGSQDWTDFEVLESERPSRIVEEGVSAKGKRRTRGTYTLEELPGGGTRISFLFEWLKTPRTERIGPFFASAFVKRANGKSMRRLAKQLEEG
jgi:uncharacterized protein YndB with AHSA1/START domain